MDRQRRLGRTDIRVSAIGLGCWQFSEGKGPIGQFWRALPQEQVNQIVAASLQGGVDWFDTAEIYGHGRSERALARALQAAGRQPGTVAVATKWFPFLRRAASIRRTIPDRLRAIAPYGLDLHQVHHWSSLSSVEEEMRVMAGLVMEGRIRAVGVSNYGARGMRRAHAALAARGLGLAANQVKYSLLDRRVERSGVLAAAKELGVTLIAYSPLAQGLLSAKFHDHPDLLSRTGGRRKLLAPFRAKGLAASRPLVEEIKRIAAAHGVTPSQVALAWLLRFHGDTVVAIPGATRPGHAVENAGAMDVALSAREMTRLDELSRPFLR